MNRWYRLRLRHLRQHNKKRQKPQDYCQRKQIPVTDQIRPNRHNKVDQTH
ncbi:uncharacterized protein METZ01_LOCUS229579, partial [marine metagenome]